MISLKQIHYALAVSKTLHFKRAAEACSVSQSALSTALTELEKQLGFQIFERDNKKVLVTPLGEQFLEKAQSIKLQVDDLYQLAEAQRKPLSSPMTIGVIPTIGPYLLPKVLPQLRKRYPDFPLSLVEEQSHVLVDMVRSGDIDCAILALPFPVDGLLSFEFWEEDFYWVSHREDPMTQSRQIKSADLDQAHLMLLRDGHCLKDHTLAACKIGGHTSNTAFNSTSLTTLIQMVAGRMGSTFVPHMAIDQLMSESSELKAVHLDEPGPHRRIAFIARPNYAGVNSLEVLMRVFKEELEKHCVEAR